MSILLLVKLFMCVLILLCRFLCWFLICCVSVFLILKFWSLKCENWVWLFLNLFVCLLVLKLFVGMLCVKKCVLFVMMCLLLNKVCLLNWNGMSGMISVGMCWYMIWLGVLLLWVVCCLMVILVGWLCVRKCGVWVLGCVCWRFWLIRCSYLVILSWFWMCKFMLCCFMCVWGLWLKVKSLKRLVFCIGLCVVYLYVDVVGGLYNGCDGCLCCWWCGFVV